MFPAKKMVYIGETRVRGDNFVAANSFTDAFHPEIRTSTRLTIFIPHLKEKINFNSVLNTGLIILPFENGYTEKQKIVDSL